MGWQNSLVDDLAPFALALVDAAGVAGLQPRVTSTRRSQSEQRRLYNRYLAGAAGFPVAPPGFSAHEYGEAFDLVVSPMSALADVGYTWQSWGGSWNPADAVHFELPGASERARQRGKQSEVVEPAWWQSIVAGLPIAFWPSVVFDLLGIPSIAVKDISIAQEEILRKIALQAK